MRKSEGKPLDLNSVQSFVRTAGFRSISGAAVSLGVAQSAVSRHIADIEALLGHRVFNRTGRGVELTRVGERALSSAETLLREAARFAEVADDSIRPRGVVSIGVLPSLTHPLVGRIYNAIAADYPEIQLRIYEAYSGEVEVMLADGRIELGI